MTSTLVSPGSWTSLRRTLLAWVLDEIGVPGGQDYARASIWAGELASAGITVNSVSPGPTETGLFRGGLPVGSPREAQLLRGIPLKRFGKPHELTDTVCLLLSEDAGYITGQILRVDGGGSITAAA